MRQQWKNSMVGGTVLKGHRARKAGNNCCRAGVWSVHKQLCPRATALLQDQLQMPRPQELSLLTGALYLQHPAQPPYTFYRSRIFMKNRSATSTVDYTIMIRKHSFMFRPEDFFFKAGSHLGSTYDP